MEHLEVTEKRGTNYTLFDLSGDLTSYTISDFQEKLYDSVLSDNVVIDLSKVGVLDSSGVGLILSAFNDSNENGNKLYILSPTLECQRSLYTTGFEDMLNVIYSVAEIDAN